VAKIRKRGKGYQIDYFDPTGKRVRKSFKKKKDAEAELGKRVSLIAEKRYLDVKKDCTTTFGGLLSKYEENFKGQRAYKWKDLCIRRFKAHFGEETIIDKIRYVDLESYRNHLRQDITRRDNLRTDASINRELACLHHIFAKAVEWEMMDRSPFDRGKTLLVKENNARLRYLTQEEIQRLLKASPEHLRNVIVCALNTGMRKGEILNLKWSQVRDGFIYLRQTKTNEPRQVPICDTLAALLKDIKAKQKPRSGDDLVFRYSRTMPPKKKLETGETIRLAWDNTGNAILDTKTAFRKAVKKAGIEDFRFHDLRHTAASHLVMAGASLKDVQEILGHKTMTMTLRYAHLSQEHKKKAVNLLNGLTAFSGLSQNVTKAVFDPSGKEAVTL